VRYQLVDTSLEGMVDQVADGTLDASIAAMTVTREREIRIDFSHPYYRSSLGIAVARSERSGLFRALSALGSPDFLVTVAILLGLLSAVGALAWMAERRANAGQFEPDARRGLFSGFWWAAVTMTTVGYGDKAPVTIRGRILGIVWMFAALVLTALVTAQLAASLTTDRISGRVGQVTDLARVRVGMVAGAASLEPLRDVGARPIPYPDVPSGLRALASGEIEAFVHDEPILVWNERTVEGVAVTPLHFAPQDYAIILPEGAPLREVVNRALLDELASEDWVAIQRRYLGRQQ
jgi:ABC-type amino acid transport substrate-binding protein